MLEEIIQIGNLIVQRKYILYLRSFFSIVLISSLTSYLYILLFGEYSIYSFVDYKAIIIFFLSGEFIKVTAIFFMSFLITNMIGSITFELFDYMMRNKFIDAIKEAGSIKELEEIETQLDHELDKKLLKKPPRLFLAIYPYFREFTDSEEFYETIQIIEANKHELRNTFLFIIRILFCLVFYLNSSVIGLGLFILMSIICCVFLFLLIYLNQFYNLLPQLIELTKEKFDAYYNLHSSDEKA